MTVRRMTPGDLALVLDWAADEGWNPGLDDGAAFLAADPGGFFVKLVEGRVVSAVSVVRQDDDNAFLGLYLCLPEYRGQGHGIEVWTAALAHAEGRTVGLDGVPAQQANYEKSGFVRAGRTVRYCGQIPERAGQAGTGGADLSALLEADARATGLRRAGFAEAWFADTDTRITVMLSDRAFATFRKCREGIKVGPFHADTRAAAEALLASVPAALGGGPIYVDVPDASAALSDLLEGMGFAPVFETARMYRGTPPDARPPAFYGVATLELG